MEPAEKIRAAVALVARLRQESRDNPSRANSVRIKRFQSKRFAVTYADLMRGGPYKAATRFFLEDLYGDTDYAERDTQFSRVAGALQRTLPAQALSSAVALAQLHALSEQLDHAMAQALLAAESDPQTAGKSETDLYIRAWRCVGRRSDRERQLNIVLKIGSDLDRLTGMPGLRTMLRVMRGPAHAAGFGALQGFLERGFDIFAAMRNQESGARGFLVIIRARESSLIELLFNQDAEGDGVSWR